MGTFVAISFFQDYGVPVPFDVGEAIIGVPILAGIAVGLASSRAEPQALVVKGFAASLGAIALVFVTVFAPVLSGVVGSLDDIGVSESTRIVSLIASLFIIPVHLLGSMIGYALAEVFPRARGR